MFLKKQKNRGKMSERVMSRRLASRLLNSRVLVSSPDGLSHLHFASVTGRLPMAEHSAEYFGENRESFQSRHSSKVKYACRGILVVVANNVVACKRSQYDARNPSTDP